MKKFIRDYLKKQGLKPQHDNFGNIYCHKGDKRKKRPFIVAHIDTVHDINDNIVTYNNGDFFYAFNSVSMKQYGVGGDDKVGIWAALVALTEFENISAAFFVQEEIGCVGSNNADMKQFRNATWLAQLDRRGCDDFIISDMASDKFNEDMKPLAESYGMKVTEQGTVTDVHTLYLKGADVSAVNIASGYYYPHTKNEVVNIEDACNSLSLMMEMVETHGTEKYEHKYKPPPLPQQTNYWNNRNGANNIGYTQSYLNSEYISTPYGWGRPAGDGLLKIWNHDEHRFEYRDRKTHRLAYYEVGANNIVRAGGTKSWSEKGGDIGSNSSGQGSLPMKGSEDESFSKAEDDYNKSGTIKTYHDFEGKWAETKKSRDQLDSVLRMFSYTFGEFFWGYISAPHVKNISASLYHQYGKTLKHYEEAFNISGTYESSGYKGPFVNCKPRKDPIDPRYDTPDKDAF